MTNNQLEHIVKILTNKVYAFCYSIVPDDVLAQELFLDAYAGFIVTEKKLILETSLDSDEVKLSFQKYLFIELLKRIYQLSLSKEKSFMYRKRMNVDEFNAYYDMKLESRCLLHLKVVLKFSDDLIMQVMSLPRNKVIEIFYFAKNELVDIKNGAPLGF